MWILLSNQFNLVGDASSSEGSPFTQLYYQTSQGSGSLDHYLGHHFALTPEGLSH